MKRDVRVHVEDILESVEKIKEYTEGLNLAEFEENTQIQDAVMTFSPT